MIKTMKKWMLDKLPKRLRKEPIVVQARRFELRLFARALKFDTSLGQERNKGKNPLSMIIETLASKFKKFWKVPSLDMIE